jgi:hypothetical protein
VRWSAGIGLAICERVAAGEPLYAVCREAGMPTPQSVGQWVRARPDFAEALEAARQAGGRPSRGGGGVWTYCEETARAIVQRVSDGESLTSIGKDPTMPCLSTIFYWRRRIPEFEEAVGLAKAIQAERFCDRACELAEAATPETAYLTHVRLTHLRWVTGIMAPRVYRLKPVEPATPPQRTDILFRHFEIEVDKATGERKVVAYCPNPDTMEAVREGTSDWRPGPGRVALPGGGADD